MSVSSSGSDRQGTVEEIRDQMIREFESALRSDRGMAILEAVVDAGSLVQILDWYHLSEHVHETKRLVFEGREKSGQRWAERILGHLWNERVDQALRSIRRTRTVAKPHQESLGDLCRYIDVSRRRMGYRRLHSMGYPVGSGVVESGIKQVVQQRHKQAGMRWSQGHAQKMLNVSACLRSDRWDELWAARRVAA